MGNGSSGSRLDRDRHINIGNPFVSAALIKGAFAIAGLLLGSALGPSWLKRTISVGLVAVGMYLQKPAGI